MILQRSFAGGWIIQAIYPDRKLFNRVLVEGWRGLFFKLQRWPLCEFLSLIRDCLQMRSCWPFPDRNTVLECAISGHCLAEFSGALSLQVSRRRTAPACSLLGQDYERWMFVKNSMAATEQKH